MNIQEFKNNLINDLRLEATYDGTDAEDVFINYALSILESQGYISDPIRRYIGKPGKRGRIMKMHGFSFDETGDALTIFICDFKDSIEERTLNNSVIETLHKQMLAFLDEACNGDMSLYFDDSNEIICEAKEMKEKITSPDSIIIKINFIILTDAVLSGKVKSIKKEDFMYRQVELSIWSLERFYELAMSTNRLETIEIDFSKYGIVGIPCVKAELDATEDYDAYLAIIPGKLLADIYLDYGSRLLEGNIRAFLSTRGKINRNIRNTIIKEPTRFFTYNNGIATTASSLKIENSLLKGISEWQIINGGQTTASLANAIIKRENPELKNIYVPMKLTVIKRSAEDDKVEAEYHDIIERIARCANSQNTVSDADFFSNHPFHVEMEKLSKKHLAPPVNGSPYPTVWFYERSRGKWEQDQMKLSPGEMKKFQQKHPKNQRVSKEKFAKCYNAFQQAPHHVAEGAARNMKHFADFIEKIYSTDKSKINEFLFKQGICSIILFDSADHLVNTQSWYPKGGNKAQIVPYAISKLMSLIPNNFSLDFARIWKEQSHYPELVKELEIVSKIAHEFLLDSSGVIVREYAKKGKTWVKFKDETHTLSKEFLKTLVSKDELISDAALAQKDQKRTNNLSVEIDVYNLGASFWRKLLEEGDKRHILTEQDIDLLSLGLTFDSIRPKLPTPAQAKCMMKIKERLEESGIII